MAIQEVNRQRQHQEGRPFNDEVMAQELDDRNTDDGKANDTPEAEVKSTGHGFRVKFFHDLALPRHIGRLNCRYIGAKHAVGNPNQRIDYLHGKGINPCFIQTQKAAAHEDRRLSRQICRNCNQTVAPGIGPHHRQDMALGILLLMAVLSEQFIEFMGFDQIALAQETQYKTARKICHAKAQKAKAAD